MILGIRFLARFLLLTFSVALIVYGIVAWQHEGFPLDGVLFFGEGGRLHPLHFLVVGIGMAPPAMWEIFSLENRTEHRRAEQTDPSKATDD